MGRGPWWVTVHGVTKSRTQPCTRTHTSIKINVPSVLATKSESFFFFFFKWSLVYICLLYKYLLNTSYMPDTLL